MNIKKITALLLAVLFTLTLFACGKGNEAGTETKKAGEQATEAENSVPADTGSDATDEETQAQPEEGDIAAELLSYFSPAPHVGETVAEFMERNPLLKDAEADPEYGGYLLKSDDLFASKNYKITKYDVSFKQRELLGDYNFDAVIAPSSTSGVFAAITVEAEDTSVRNALKAYYEKNYETEEEHNNMSSVYYLNIKDGENTRRVMYWNSRENSFEMYYDYEYGSEAWNKDNDALLFKERPVSEMADTIKSIFADPRPEPGEKPEDYVKRNTRKMGSDIARDDTYHDVGVFYEKWIGDYEYCGSGSYSTLMNGDQVYSEDVDEQPTAVTAYIMKYEDAVELFDTMTEYYKQMYGEENLDIEKSETETKWRTVYKGDSYQTGMEMEYSLPRYCSTAVYQFEFYFKQSLVKAQ